VRCAGKPCAGPEHPHPVEHDTGVFLFAVLLPQAFAARECVMHAAALLCLHSPDPRLMHRYSLEEVEGQTNSILHGPDTDDALLAELMASVRRGEPSSATLVNYKKGGKRFVNQVRRAEPRVCCMPVALAPMLLRLLAASCVRPRHARLRAHICS
jgi:hypothetical protein